MAKRSTKKIETPPEPTTYRSAVCGLGNAVATANELDTQGYDIKYCFAVVAQNDAKEPVQAVYILAKRRDA